MNAQRMEDVLIIVLIHMEAIIVHVDQVSDQVENIVMVSEIYRDVCSSNAFSVVCV